MANNRFNTLLFRPIEYGLTEYNLEEKLDNKQEYR